MDVVIIMRSSHEIELHFGSIRRRTTAKYLWKKKGSWASRLKGLHAAANKLLLLFGQIVPSLTLEQDVFDYNSMSSQSCNSVII